MTRIHYLCANGHLYTAEVPASALNDGAYLTATCPVDAAAAKAQVPMNGNSGPASGMNSATGTQVMLNGKSGGLQEGPAAAKGTAVQSPRPNYSTYPGVYDGLDNMD